MIKFDIFIFMYETKEYFDLLIGQHKSIIVVATSYVAVHLWGNWKDTISSNGCHGSLLRRSFCLSICAFHIESNISVKNIFAN